MTCLRCKVLPRKSSHNACKYCAECTKKMKVMWTMKFRNKNDKTRNAYLAYQKEKSRTNRALYRLMEKTRRIENALLGDEND